MYNNTTGFVLTKFSQPSFLFPHSNPSQSSSQHPPPFPSFLCSVVKKNCCRHCLTGSQEFDWMLMGSIGGSWKGDDDDDGSKKKRGRRREIGQSIRYCFRTEQRFFFKFQHFHFHFFTRRVLFSVNIVTVHFTYVAAWSTRHHSLAC